MDMRKRLLSLVVVMLVLSNLALLMMLARAPSSVAGSSPEELIARTSGPAVASVFRLVSPARNKSGTGFLHSSGRIVTSAHLVEGCKPSEVYIIPPIGKQTSAVKIVVDSELDIALLTPKDKIERKGLSIGGRKNLPVGAQLAAWGYPDGYSGRVPLLCVGWFSGVRTTKAPSGESVKRFMVNAAFNKGNSGGPVIDVRTGEVVGMVCSKLAPLPRHINTALQALEQHKQGFMAERTRPDGSKERLTQSQLLAEVLQHLRGQTQLVIGEAVTGDDIEGFLATHPESD